jgi:hypothetical protein
VALGAGRPTMISVDLAAFNSLLKQQTINGMCVAGK